jgi:hypothetical protein
MTTKQAPQITEIHSTHWTEGGTGITNFPPEQASLFLRCIKKSNFDDLYVSNKPMLGSNNYNGYSLHCMSMKTGKSLSDFWSIFWQEEKNENI